MLDNAMMAGDKNAMTAGDKNAMTAGDKKAMTAGDAKAISYHLEGGDLKAHVGHKVSVTGSMGPKMGTMGKGEMMDKDKMGTTGAHGTLNVKSVKMISPTCQ